MNQHENDKLLYLWTGTIRKQKKHLIFKHETMIINMQFFLIKFLYWNKNPKLRLLGDLKPKIKFDKMMKRMWKKLRKRRGPKTLPGIIPKTVLTPY